MTYLVLRLQSLGNVAMLVPTLTAVSQHYREDRFIVVAKKRLNALFYGLDNVTFIDADDESGRTKGALRLYRELNKLSIDALIDLQDSGKTVILRWLFRTHHIPCFVIRYGWQDKRTLTTKGAKRAQALPTEHQRYMDTFRMAGLEVEDSFTGIAVNEPARIAVQQHFGQKGAKETWYGIAPFAKSGSNILPYKTTKELIRKLSSRPNTRVFLFGAGVVEQEVLRQWSIVGEYVTSVAGIVSLEEELELMRELNAMICMDSANQHLASLVNLRVVSIWMATHPKMGFYGWHQKPDDAIGVEALTCRPCTIHGTNSCRFGNFACKYIDADKILQQLDTTD